VNPGNDGDGDVGLLHQ